MQKLRLQSNTFLKSYNYHDRTIIKFYTFFDFKYYYFKKY